MVASFTDAWIETCPSCSRPSLLPSHLLQMRGLKPTCAGKRKQPIVASFTDAWIETGEALNGSVQWMVASFTDAWIETGRTEADNRLCQSHLLQMRGLKPFICSANNALARSHLLQMRGLKHLTSTMYSIRWRSHLLQMRGLKREAGWRRHRSRRRIFYRCVD